MNASRRYEVLNGYPIGRSVICDFSNITLKNGDDVRVLADVADDYRNVRWVVDANHEVAEDPDAPGFWAEAQLTTAAFNPRLLVLTHARPLGESKYESLL